MWWFSNAEHPVYPLLSFFTTLLTVISVYSTSFSEGVTTVAGFDVLLPMLKCVHTFVSYVVCPSSYKVVR